jgi:hypothetical protein
VLGRIGVAGACVVGLVGCVRPSNQINPNDPAYGHRWHASLATPSSLQGVAQASGEVSWGPGKGDESVVHVRLANAVPGGVHPWTVRRGQCGDDQGVVASPDRYPPLTVGRDGVANQTTALEVPLPIDGQYFVSVQASSGNIATVYACGNLSPPVR